VFAAARTCTQARQASRSRGAFVHVDLAALDRALEATRAAAGGPPRSSALAFLAYLIATDAGTGLRSLELARHTHCDASAAHVAALFVRARELCVLAIPSPTGALAWPPGHAAAILRAAAANALPLRHVSAPLVAVPLDALPRLPLLTSLALCHDATEPAHARVAPELLLAAQEVLPQLSRLRQLLLQGCVMLGEERRPHAIAVRSPTLRSLVLNGAGLVFAAVDCPRLTHVDLSVGLPVPGFCSNTDYAAAALALIRGCPLLPWRAPHAQPPAVGLTPVLLQRAAWAWRRRVEAAAAAALNDPLPPLLLDDADAVRFLIRLSRHSVGHLELSDD
jgi:hypothetical protein